MNITFHPDAALLVALFCLGMAAFTACYIRHVPGMMTSAALWATSSALWTVVWWTLI